MFRVYAVQFCYDTRWLMGLCSTQAKMEDTVLKAAWYYGTNCEGTKQHSFVCRPSVPVGILGGECIFFPTSWNGHFFGNYDRYK